MKRFLCLSGIIMLIATNLSGCRVLNKVAIDKNKNLKIGISVYDQYDTFISEMMSYLNDWKVKKEEETGVGITLFYLDAASSQGLQNDQVDTFIQEGCDIMLINLVDRTDATMVIDKAKSGNIPVIFFNRELVEEDLKRWNNLYYVGAEAFESGIFQGQIVIDEYNKIKKNNKIDKNGDGKIQYVMLEGEAGHQDALIRTEYSVNTIIEAGVPIERLATEIANWSRSQAAAKMRSWLSDPNLGDNIELVLANNDDMAMGAADALEKAGKPKEKWPIIVGVDGTDAALESIKNGRMLGTALNDGKGQARALLELAYSVTFNTELPKDLHLIDNTYIRLPYLKVTIENVWDISLKK